MKLIRSRSIFIIYLWFRTFKNRNCYFRNIYMLS